ncbi:hypothetical protein [Salisaeta longa]|uniref:hypothetical protein n=1 Tax=Salisaeta longa TaxID=503170 RepID=UPI0003B79780|nr:hypothetical protein [Salisaeta longa]
MDSTDTHTGAAPPSPALTSPYGAEVVDGRQVTFAWEPVERATGYTLQVARDANFSDLVLDKDVAQQTAVEVGNYLPTDGQTFFWRVLSYNDAGTSPGERVESFVAATEAEAARHTRAPDDGEAMGPATELVQAAAQDVEQKLTPEERLAKEKEQGVADEGIAASLVMGIAGSTLLIIALAIVIVFVWFQMTKQQVAATRVAQTPNTLVEEATNESNRLLNEYGVVDAEAGIYRMPIEQAMDVVVNKYDQTPPPSAPSSE